MPAGLDLSRIAPSLRRDPDGIWRAASVAAVSYPDDGHHICHDLEESSFWFAHRNACLVAAMRRLPPQGTLLDVGGGNGFVARGLVAAGFDAALLEPGATGAANAQRRGLPLVIQASLADAGLQPGSVPAVGLFDVVEHIADDAAFLREVRVALQPGGRVYLTVPAYGWLWSPTDDTAGHFRRYTLGSLRAALAGAGFEVEYATPFFALLVPAVFLLRALPARLGLRRDDAAQTYQREHAGPGARVAAALLQGELRLIAAGRRLPVGASLLAVARKP